MIHGTSAWLLTKNENSEKHEEAEPRPESYGPLGPSSVISTFSGLSWSVILRSLALEITGALEVFEAPASNTSALDTVCQSYAETWMLRMLWKILEAHALGPLPSFGSVGPVLFKAHLKAGRPESY